MDQGLPLQTKSIYRSLNFRSFLLPTLPKIETRSEVVGSEACKLPRLTVCRMGFGAPDSAFAAVMMWDSHVSSSSQFSQYEKDSCD